MRIIFTVVSIFLILGMACEAPQTDESRPEQAAKQVSSANVVPSPTLSGVEIGAQTWTLTNVDIGHFRNGDPIPQLKDDAAWKKAGREKKPGWCYFKNDAQFGKQWGRLYNYYAVTDARGLAPEGWKVPTRQDYEELLEALGGANGAATQLREASAWEGSKKGKASGFAALPSRGRFDDQEFIEIGDFGYWWTQTPGSTGRNAYYLALNGTDEIATISSLHCGYGFALRLLKE